MQQLQEGRTTFTAFQQERVSKEMEVFYNPVMKLNRDLSILVLASHEWKRQPRICLPMEASGVRAARIMHELVQEGLISPAELVVNDINEDAVTLLRKNLAPYAQDWLRITQQDANTLLRERTGYEYIDIDPFGSPNTFLDAAIRRLTRGGILAVTATDTSALAGTYPRVTKRKYWAVPSRTWAMHDLGLRILIRKVQLVAAQYEKALVPVLSVSADHYYRVFFLRTQKAEDVKTVLAQHKYAHVNKDVHAITVSESNVSEACEVAGPLWTGPLHDPALVERMLANAQTLEFKEAEKLLSIIKDECTIDVVGFLDLHVIAQKLKKSAPKRDALLEKLAGKACRTHVLGTGIKTLLPVSEIENLY